MKTSKKLKIMAAALAATVSATSMAADPADISVNFWVRPDGNRADFHTTVTVDYPVGVSLTQIDRALHHAPTLDAMSSIVTRVEIAAGTEGTSIIKTRGTTEVGGIDFHKWTFSRCSTKRSNGTFTQLCSMVLAGGDTSEFFERGGSRSVCTQNTSRVRCTHEGWGRVKEVKKAWIVLRTAPRLAIGGAAQLIADFSSLALLLQGDKDPVRGSQRLDSWALKERLYTEGRAYIENDHLTPGKKMVIRGSNAGAFSLGEI